ncbi:choline/ethanolaminephosphotransferase 1-like [Octopus sinensis]|uniref:Choline/ethanolaminephosphotransferase 1-like n=1 Tax=Octopus sinensis TaxID=2607531 RepID=A0A6P7TT06_9MOLL|nr:choline/ethanolaminephosphotransferase 1-like [Octopus sinensis]
MTALSDSLAREEIIIYMDNAPIHKKQGNFEGVRVEHTIQRFDAPYSPQLNPCESCFSIIKAGIKKYLSNHNNPHNDVHAAGNGTLTVKIERRIFKIGIKNVKLELKMIPSWTFIMATVCLFLYQTLDAIDGKHARRTGNVSPLGELFDHGCDSLATGKQLNFKSQLDVTEFQLFIMGVYGLTSYFGQNIWTDVILFGLSLRMYLFVTVFIFSWHTIFAKISIIFKGGVGRNGSSVAETSVISPAIPLFISVVSSYYVVCLYDDYFASRPLFLLLVLSISPVKQSTDIILRRMTRSSLTMFDSCLLTQLILILNARLSRLLNFELLFVICVMYALWDYCLYIYSVCYQISSFLGIHVLFVQKSQQVINKSL